MTLDIVEKLRRELTMATFATPADLFEALNAERREAADEIERLREDCAEAYQVCGAALLGPDKVKWTDDDAVRVLDNLSAAANGDPRPHDDLLPWPKPIERKEDWWDNVDTYGPSA